MSYNCSSGNFSSQSFGGYLRQPVSTYNYFYPSNGFYSPKNFQLGSSFYNGQQENFTEPLEDHVPYVGTRSYQSSWYRPRNFIFSSPYQSFGYGASGFGSFGFGNSGIQSLGCGSSFHRPAYFSKSVQSSYYQPGFGSSFYGSSF